MSIRYFIACGLLVCSIGAIAQQKKSGRPFKGVDVSTIPRVPSLKGQLSKGQALKNTAVPVGTAQKEPLPAAIKGIAGSEPETSDRFVSLWKVARASNGTVNWMWNVHSKTNSVEPQSVKVNDGIKVLTDLKRTLRIADPSREFKIMSDQKDELGNEHIRYAQYYKDVPVWNSDLYVHFGQDGLPTVINGTYEPTPTGVNTTPGIVPEAAMIVCIHDLQVKDQWAPVSNSSPIYKSLSANPEAKLVIFPIDGKQPRLAYEVSITANLLQSYYYIIDAESGEIIQRTDHYCSLIGEPKLVKSGKLSHEISNSHVDPYPLLDTDPMAMPQAGFANASGKDLNGVTQQFRTYQHSDGNFYLIWDLPSFNGAGSNLPDDPKGGALTLNLKSQDYAQGSTIFHNVSPNNNWDDPAAVSAHFNTNVAYNYYATTFARKAIDDKDGLITSITHVSQNGQGMDNAFWNGGGKVMIYGDGKTQFKSLAGGLDVAGHEMTHGVTENSANLVYQLQSGALNESMSDVFGVMIDPNNLLLGEQVVKNGTCLRDLANPHNDAGVAHQPAKVSEMDAAFNDVNNDNGGVHINSGIPNHAAAILIQQLGRDKVQKIYYRVLTSYLTRESQFIDCRRAVIQAAKDLFGAGSESAAAASAFDQVEIFDGGSNGGNDNVGPRHGGTEFVTFYVQNGQIIYLNLKNDSAYATGGSARMGSGNESSSVLTVPRNGQSIYFIDPTLHLGFVDVATGQPFNFPNLFISDNNGDLWNASIAPDNTIAAMASAYENDPNMYFFDGTGLRPPFRLNPQQNDGGSISTIDYPDVISWSPNLKQTKISFDALNVDKYGNTDVNYWSIYEIDTSGNIYSMVPADASVDLGNICYSNTNPDVVAFNSIVNGIEDVHIADFEHGVLISLNLHNRTVNGHRVDDGNRPTFSPDDKRICFSSGANNALMFYTLESGDLSFFQFPGVVPNMPFWFLQGGTEAVKSVAKSTVSVSVSPSIVKTVSDIAVTVDKSSEVTIDIININGITVQSILNRRLDAGTTHLSFERNALASGTYFIRLRATDEQKTVKIILE